MTQTTKPLRDCFADFNRRFPQIRGEIRSEIQLLSDFTKCEVPGTIRRWLLNERSPVGENKFRSIAFFHLIGYKVSEFENARPLYQKAILLFALDAVAPIDLATKGFQITGQSVTDKLYRSLSENNDILPKKVPFLIEYVESYSADHDAAMELFSEKYGVLKQVPTPQVIAVPVQAKVAAPTAKTSATPTVTNKIVIETIAHMLHGLLPLATIAASDGFSPEERAQLREMMGLDGIFRLSNIFEKLCGERARTEH